MTAGIRFAGNDDVVDAPTRPCERGIPNRAARDQRAATPSIGCWTRKLVERHFLRQVEGGRPHAVDQVSDLEDEERRAFPACEVTERKF